MQTTLHPRPTPTARPSAARRSALVVTGLLACALPTVWTVNLARMLVVAELPEHRFHQLTGQGLLLCLLWLGSVVPLLRAGWRGERPATSTAFMHLSFMAIGTALSLVAPQGGALGLMVVIDVTGALVWWALPVRPRLAGRLRIDPLLAPLGLLLAAVAASYAVTQVGLQHAATGHHAQNPHYFDMAWFTTTLAALVVLAAVRPDVRPLSRWGGAAAMASGVAGLLLATDLAWAAPAVAIGGLVLLAPLAGRRDEKPVRPAPVL